MPAETRQSQPELKRLRTESPQLASSADRATTLPADVQSLAGRAAAADTAVCGGAAAFETEKAHADASGLAVSDADDEALDFEPEMAEIYESNDANAKDSVGPPASCPSDPVVIPLDLPPPPSPSALAFTREFRLRANPRPVFAGI